MPLHIGQLISNVNVNPASAPTNQATASMPTLDLVMRQVTQQSSAVSQPASAAPPSNPTSSPTADPEALADRIYRLLIDEVTIGRERV